VPSGSRIAPSLTAAPARIRRGVLRHRRLLAFVLTAGAALGALHATRPAPSVTVPVVVAARDLPGGVTLTSADLLTVQVPAGDVPAGAEPRAAGGVLAAAVRRGEPITDVRLLGAPLAHSEPALTAVPVRFGDAAMAALLHVGDRVRLLATDPTSGETRTVAEDALVLAVPQAPAADEQSSAAGTQAGRLVVVGVADGLVTDVTGAAVGGFLTFAYDH
jgi:Flp pilus assembly protein CpaB